MVILMALLFLSFQADARTKSDAVSASKFFLKNYLDSKRDFHLEGLVESLHGDRDHTWGEGNLYFNKEGAFRIEYTPFNVEEKTFSYQLGNSDPHSLGSLYFRSLASLYADSDLGNTLFDFMRWNLTNSNRKIVIDAISISDLQIKALSFEWDEENNLKVAKIAIDNNAFAFWISPN